MARSGSYKQYSRSNREYTLENTFTGGMKYSNAPIKEGEIRIINNFDLSDDRLTLTPREGFRFSTSVLSKAFNNIPGLNKLYFFDNEDAKRALIEQADNTLEFAIAKGKTQRKTKLELDSQETLVSDIHNVPVLPENQVRKIRAIVRAYNNKYYVPNQGEKGGFYIFKDDIDDHEHDPEGIYNPEVLEPRNLTASEAALYGYNMLSKTPYSFKDDRISGTEPNILLNGCLPYKPVESGIPSEINFDPRVNETVTFRAFYHATPGTYYYTWLTRTSTDDIYTIKKVGTFTISEEGELPLLLYDMAVPYANVFVSLQIWACEKLDTDEEPTGEGKDSTIYYYKHDDLTSSKWYWSTVEKKYIACTQNDIVNDVPVLQAEENSFEFTDNVNTSMRGMEFKEYDLSTSKGLTFWAGSLVYYAPNGGENMLFCSAYNEPEFFPYPNNTDIFDESIKYCVPYMNNLLVFTDSQLWLLTRQVEGGWVKSLVQGNLHISDYDINFIQVIKNMVFFKSTNNYFMVVPKASSTTGELTLAPVSRQLDEFFNNFSESAIDVIKSTYGDYAIGVDNHHFDDARMFIRDAYNFLDYEDIHNVFMLYLIWPDGYNIEITLEILYNTVVRYWRTYTHQSHYRLNSYTADATQPTDMMAVVPNGEEFSDLVLVKRSSENREDLLYENITDPSKDLLNKYYPNYQLLDSGYHDYLLETKKRFRELQLFVNNLSKSDLIFGLGFTLDNTNRIPLYEYDTTINKVGNTNVLFLNRRITNQVDVPGTMQVALWKLKQTITKITLWKIRSKISGKGYAPRFKFVSQNEKAFELINFIWVYRVMYLR